jgi:N-acetyl-gamma-glutamyl-phosphate reductase
MEKFKVFVDGQEGTTGLEINERLQKRNDVEILLIDPEKRKDAAEREKFLNRADVVFLCLPDDAAREAVSLIENPSTRVIDASTAHRTNDDWAYGIPELSEEHRAKIANSKRVSNPGCFATGFAMLIYPLVREGFIPPDYPVSCHAVTGYSGGGKKLIAFFESEEHRKTTSSPCFYGLKLQHKHVPEMRKHSGLSNNPLFTPIVANFYRGMTVAVPLHTELMSKKADGMGADAAGINAFYKDDYMGQKFVKTLPVGVEDEFEWGYMNAESCNYTNNIEILVFGNDSQILVTARLDNLGKGASGAAIQNMNIMLGLDEAL